jgi:hypothetical protein
MRKSVLAFAPCLVALLGISACGTEDAPSAGGDSAFSSNQATLLEFEFDGTLLSDVSWNDQQTIQDQLLYTIGHLNEDRSVGRLDALTLSNIQKTTENGKTKITYHAVLPVAWGSKTNLPKTYEFTLPKDVSQAGQQAFTAAHKDTCVDWSAHEVDQGSMWYYFRPGAAACSLTDDEVVKSPVTITTSPLNTTKKYPEYHRVWEDNRLEVVAIFGKYEIGGKAGDVGVTAFNTFVKKMKADLKDASLVTTPANVSDTPGPDTNDVTLERTLPDGKTVKVTALMVDAITDVWPGFKDRYEALTPTADMIAYNGHAGLGQNVRALAKMGSWLPQKYQMFFMNGCDTFAYVDGSLAMTRTRLNPDDPTGTKYLEFVTNAMPSPFASMADASIALIDGLMSTAAPKSYDEMFVNIQRSEVVLVTGEEDNVFTPGMPIGKAP